MMDWKFSAIVIDDDPLARSVLEKFLESDGRIQVIPGLESALNAVEAIERLKPDVIFLDINMPYEDGLCFASRLKASGNSSFLIFCTAFKNYALEAFELHPYGFLVKPFGISDIILLNDKIINELEKRKSISQKLWTKENLGKYKFKTFGGYVFFKPEEIFLVKCSGNNSEVLSVTGTTVRVQSSLSEIFEYLGDKQFFKANRSFVVNIKYIVNIDRKTRSCFMKFDILTHEILLTANSITELENKLILKLG